MVTTESVERIAARASSSDVPLLGPRRIRAVVRGARRLRAGPAAIAPSASDSRAMLEQSWDGEWYRRAYFDDGTPLGSAQNDEGRIDSVAQTWAVLSGAAPLKRAERAMDAVRSHLVRRASRVILLLTPPFDRTALDPGYIKGYLPGIRENGGQYTHAAQWVVLALAKLGSGDEAVELFHMLNPINHSRTPGRRAAIQDRAVRGCRGCVRPSRSPRARRMDLVHRDRRAGCIASRSKESSGCIAVARFSAWIRAFLRHGRPFRSSGVFGARVYSIRVENPERRCRGVATVTVDGARVDASAIPLVDDGGVHRVHVVLGIPGAVIEPGVSKNVLL